MSEARNITLERVNRLTQVMADLTESHAAQGRMIARLLEQISNRLSSMDDRLSSMDKTMATIAKDVHDLASEQILLGNRIEDAFARALRANMRLDEREDGGDDQR